MSLVEGHPDIGKRITYPRGGQTVEGIVTLVKREQGFEAEFFERKIAMKTITCLRYKIQPSDGRPAFWSSAVVDEEAIKEP